MPIYEYRCDDCEGRFEVLTSFAERDRAQHCPACESRRTRVMVSTFASLGGEDGPDFGMAAGGGASAGCACGGACSCGGH